MAKGQRALADEMKKRDQQSAAQYQQSLATASTPSAAETQAEKDRAAFFQWRDAGDYTKPPPTLIGLSYGPQAAARRLREQSAVGTGAFGMGAQNADPTALALAKQNMGDVNAENDANAYQGAISDEYTYQRTGNSQALMAQDFARKMGLLGATEGQTQFATGARINTTPQSILPMLLSGLVGGAGNFFSGGFSSLMKPGATPAHP